MVCRVKKVVRLLAFVLGWMAGAGVGIAAEEPKLGLDGQCPVCLAEMKKWEPGTAEFVSDFDGFRYQFPNAEIRDKFAATPEKYAPVLNGDCIVCYAKMGERVPGSVKFASRHEGRVYLFPSDKERQMFVANPAEFADADLAVKGECAVCLVKMKEHVPGNPEFVARFNGLRYLFPSDKERAMFLESPAEFAAELGLGPKSASNSKRMVSFTGRTGCAACEYGVKPLNAPGELGLAITTAEDEVFVIEDAHQLWPELYEQRFEHATVSVTGNVIKSEGKYRWIKALEIHTL